MKRKSMVRTCAATATVNNGTAVNKADMCSIYIEMLCEKFKDRGIRTVGASAENAELYRKLDIDGSEDRVNASDSKYKSLNINGRPMMSSDDFAAYYKDLRDYKMPRFYSRAESEYETAKALAEKKVQESGNPPKKLYGLL